MCVLGSLSSPAGFHTSVVAPCTLYGTSGQNAFSVCSKEGLLPSQFLHGAGGLAALPVTLVSGSSVSQHLLRHLIRHSIFWVVGLQHLLKLMGFAGEPQDSNSVQCFVHCR